MTANSENDVKRRFSRRSMLLGTGGLVLGAGGIASGSTVLGDEDDERTRGDRGGRSAAASGGLLDQLRTEAFIVDLDGDGALTTETQLVGDPSGERRETAVHVTSNGQSSRDVPVLGVDLRDDGLALADAGESDALAFDYYKDADSTHPVPDQVLLFLRTSSDGFAVAFRGADAEATGTWETRDVSSEVAAGGWRAIEADADDIDLDAVRRLVGDGFQLSDVGGLLSMTGGLETVRDLTGRFGDASVLGMGIAVGAFEAGVTHAYYDGLRVAGEERPLPAVLEADTEIASPQGRGGGRVTASLSFDAAQAVSAADVDPDSVRLTTSSPVAPPMPGTPWAENAATARNVTVTADGLEAEFVPGQVRRLQRGGNGPLVVYGDFDVDEPYTFVGVGDS